ncbi:MAG: copper amine oxidase N-terminal domain-containing protein [Butyricicoccus sp.]|nr:copper amine oxidase N-terminal domain-containing protein [Butyricicoccus sp.]
MKKILSLALALALCLGLAFSAFAENLTARQINEYDCWGDGPSLTVNGVVAKHKTELALTTCLDVTVGGSLVLELDFPEGRNRVYRFMMAGVYIPSDLKSPPSDEDMPYITEGWEIADSKMAYEITQADGISQYVYNFTSDEVGQLRGHDKAIYMDIYYEDDVGEDESSNDGSSCFYLRVVPADPAEPSVPKVQLSSQPLTVDGEAVTAQAYNIGGSNFFKLRDVAMMLNGTGARFSVGYDADTRTATATSGEAYTAIGGELTAGEDMSASCVVSDQSIIVNGEALKANVYNIAGSNYFMLRDLGSALGFDVGYDAATRTVLVTTK